MKRKILILLMILFITGCSSEYNLKIGNNSFKEKINFLVETKQSDYAIEEGIEVDDQLTPFLEEETSSLITNDKFYKKKVINYDNYSEVEMSYKYNEKEFENSNSINLCFEYPELDFSENYYIHLQGKFYCLYSDYIDIKIETNKKVYSNNADEIIGNTYIWHIDESNVDYVDIEIEVDKGISIGKIISIILGIIFSAGIIYVIYKFYQKNKEKNKI